MRWAPFSGTRSSRISEASHGSAASSWLSSCSGCTRGSHRREWAARPRRHARLHSTDAALRVRVRELRAPLRTAARDERRRAGLPELHLRARDAWDLDVRRLHVEQQLPELGALRRRVRVRRQLHVRRSLTSETRWRSAPPRRRTSAIIVDTAARSLDAEAMLRWSFGEERFEERVRAALRALRRRERTPRVDRAGRRRCGHRSVDSSPTPARSTRRSGPPRRVPRTAVLGDHADHHAAFWGWVGEHEPQEPLSYLSHVGVAPERQGEGIGTALMHDGLARAEFDGVAAAWLETSKATNATYYKRFGFRTVVPTRTLLTAARTSGSMRQRSERDGRGRSTLRG